METVKQWVGRISLTFAALIVVAMMLQVVIDVFMRSFLGAGFPATADLVGRYYMVSVSFLPLAMTEIARRHIEATIFTDKLTGAPRKAVLIFGYAIALIVFGILTYGATQEAMTQTARGAYVDAGTLHFPTWPSYWIPSVSFGLMEIALAISLIELLTGRFKDDPHDPLEEIHSHIEEAH